MSPAIVGDASEAIRLKGFVVRLSVSTSGLVRRGFLYTFVSEILLKYLIFDFAIFSLECKAFFDPSALSFLLRSIIT